MQPSPKSLVLDLLSTLKGGAMPVRALVAAGELFEIDENRLRVALARLRASGLVDCNERGQYRLGVSAEAVGGEVASWRRTEQRIRAWDGGWIGVHVAALARSNRRAVQQREQALRLLGFRELSHGLEVRPDNLVGGVEAIRDQLRALGLEAEALVFRVNQLDPATERRTRGLWDVEQLLVGYRRSRAELEQSEKRLAELTMRESMVESFLLGGSVIRQLVLDPLLPEAIVPPAERALLVQAMLRYDRLGRACWNGFMREFAVLPFRTPANLRATDVSAPLPRAAEEARA